MIIVGGVIADDVLCDTPVRPYPSACARQTDRRPSNTRRASTSTMSADQRGRASTRAVRPTRPLRSLPTSPAASAQEGPPRARAQPRAATGPHSPTRRATRTHIRATGPRPAATGVVVGAMGQGRAAASLNLTTGEEARPTSAPSRAVSSGVWSLLRCWRYSPSASCVVASGNVSSPRRRTRGTSWASGRR